MGSGGPLVSVVAVCYNQARFVVEGLESIRCQTYPNLQLILVDDASSDGSASVIQDWLDRTDTVATFVRHTENQGVCRSRNDAFAHVEGDYVAATSVDDVWLPEHLARAVDLIQRLPRTTASCTRMPTASRKTGGGCPRCSSSRSAPSTRCPKA